MDTFVVSVLFVAVVFLSLRTYVLGRQAARFRKEVEEFASYLGDEIGSLEVRANRFEVQLAEETTPPRPANADVFILTDDAFDWYAKRGADLKELGEQTRPYHSRDVVASPGFNAAKHSKE